MSINKPASYREGGTRTRTIAAFTLMAVLLLALVIANICIGSVEVTLGQMAQIVFGGDRTSTAASIMISVRMPRLIACVLLGGSLALAGFLLQTFFNNPIADPYILGISSGAKLMVAIVTIVLVGSNAVIGSWAMIGAAFAGSLISMAFVLAISQRVNSMSMLILAGVMVGYICSAATNFLVAFATEQNIVNLYNWSLGSFSGVGWDDVRIMTVVSVLGCLAVFAISKPLGAYQLGEQYAQSMGVNIKRFRVLLIVLSSLLAGCVTAFAGPISFVGIAVPHLMKSLLHSSKPIRVIPASFLGGACFCLGCDLIARTLFSPTELSISAVTAAFGAPIVIYMMLRRKKARR